MMYSVWNHAQRCYDYYRTPETSAAVNAPSPRHLLLGSPELGLAPEEAAWPLPSDATPAGNGAEAKGQIASKESLGSKPMSKPLVLFAAGLALAWFWR